MHTSIVAFAIEKSTSQYQTRPNDALIRTIGSYERDVQLNSEEQV